MDTSTIVYAILALCVGIFVGSTICYSRQLTCNAKNNIPIIMKREHSVRWADGALSKFVRSVIYKKKDGGSHVFLTRACEERGLDWKEVDWTFPNPDKHGSWALELFLLLAELGVDFELSKHKY